MHFSVNIMDDAKYDTSADLEYHFSFNPYNERKAPSNSPCWLLGAPCWHEGTSLYAIETVWPMVEGSLRAGDHESVFRTLEHEYEDKLRRVKGGNDDE